MSSQSDPNVFSVRIVSLDYYMSPPIPDLDFCYSSFQGRKVEEVPVIRIYGSTPAGQKACLHIHRALPYLYIPCPDDVLRNPEEGHAFIHILSSALEKALRHKSSSAQKKQHVHGCRLVRAKKLYGYHSSEDMFVKIYLYYPHEVARTATLLLDGAILSKTFQPYESHIPYLLQFLVDYNLYGMSHIHTAKAKFRPPIPDGYIPRVSCFKKNDMQAHGNSAIWLSSTVPSALIWPDSATGDDGLEDKTIHLIRRQSICGLEVDSSVDDILNEKYKMYTSLSQTRSELKMVQSLVPIWEEEYERSGTPEAVQFPDLSKPLPENVLGSFLHGLEYEKALAELCIEIEKTFPSKVSAIEGDEKLEKFMESFTSTGKALTPLEHQRPGSPFGERLKCPREESKNVPLREFHGRKSAEKTLFEMYETTKPERLDTEALGLLSWLASSQAVEDFSADDELVHEAILSPLLPTKSYREAVEIAHLDYESASQQECQDILDSVEGFLKSEGLKEQVSHSAHHEYTGSVLSGNVIPQVDGSFDDNFKTPQKGDFSEANMTSGREKSSAHQVGRCTSTRFGSKCRRSNLLWRPLPFPIKQKEHEDSESAFFVSSHDEEMKNDSESSSSFGNKGDRCCDVLKVDAGVETSGEKGGKIVGTWSVRDLMRRKRCFRTEESETEVQKNEMVALCPEGPMHQTSDKERCYVMPTETPNVESSSDDRDGLVQENITCTTACTQDACTKGYRFLPTDYRSPVNQKSSISLFSDQVMQSNIILNEHLQFHKKSTDGECIEASTGSRSFAIMGQSLPQAESIKFFEPCQSGLLGTAICSTFSGGHEEEMPDASQSFMKSCNKKLSVESQKFTSRVREKQSVDEGLKSHQCESQSVDEHLLDKLDFGTGDLTTIHAEQTILHDINKYKTNHNIAREGLLETHFNRCAESDFALNKNVQQSDNHVRGGWDMGISSLNPDCITCTDLHKGRDTLEYIEMTISRKPPSRDEVDRSSGDSPGTTGHADGCADTNNESLAFKSCFVDSDGQWMNDFPPFFVRNLEDGKSYKSFLNDDNLVFHQESALGVPTHFQNDGSVLYLLTNAVSPPTLQCVCQWLLDVTQKNCLNDAVGASIRGLLSSSSDPFLIYNCGLREAGNACDGTSLESNAAHHLKPDLSSSSQENMKSPKTGNYSSHIDIVSSERHVAGIHMKENALINKWHDISQISGPDQEEKSKLTPLSQIGFRDPASIGGGQQLTLISMEVQAESRGDLRPDPKVDAINVLSLAVQEDTSHTFEVYVLMRGNNEELCGRNVDGVSDCKFVIFNEEKHLLDHFVKIISSSDPDVLMGWEIQGGSLGFLAERAAHLGISLLKKISRTPAYETKHKASDSANPELYNMHHEALIADTVIEDSIIEDDWGRTHASGIHVGGRIVLNVWRLMRSELKLNMYSVEAVAEEVLRRKIPSIPCRVLNHWFSSGPGRARYRCVEYVTERAKLNLQIMNQLDMVNRTSELARIFGIDFFSVLSRGSQFRVESMLLRLAHTQNYLAISPGSQQVASQPAMECLPLVMEPESGFYADPVVVLDFQSLYPSMIIAYNLCFCTCLGTVVPSKTNILGVTSYLPDPLLLKDSKQLLLTPNGIMYVPPKVRKGVLPRLLEEILSTRIMVKQAMKKLMPSQQVLQRIFNARQLALKLIANVTYGYTAAGFSGRMPCAELADSIVQCGRRTLETAISFVNQHDKWKARVIYGDTDSMFVLLKGRSREEAFRIGNEIASAITAMNPNPVMLKMEKVYHPCFLLTKKRYVGYSYESPDQDKPTFDAKGIETVRRDTCSAVAKTLERSIRLIFEHQDISVVKTYLQRQWTRILSGKFSLEDFVFAKEVRLGTYSARASSLPPAAIVATKAMRIDPRAEPRYGERIPYVVIHGEPGARLVDMVVCPSDLLDINSPYRLNELYYINKQIIPALQRVFGLVGADLNKWFSELPRLVRPTLAKRHSYVSHSGSLHECDVDIRPESSKKAQAKRSRIDTYYISNNCTLCGELALASAYLCDRCSKKESLVATAVVGKASRLEREIQHLAAICRHCGGGDWIMESGVKCTSIACSVFYEGRKLQKELRAISSFATIAGFYPSCMAEWF